MSARTSLIDLDLLVAGGREDHVELRLLLLGLRAAAAAAAGRRPPSWAPAAAALTSNASSNALMNSDSSRSVISLNCSSRSSVPIFDLRHGHSFLSSSVILGLGCRRPASVASASGAPRRLGSASALAARLLRPPGASASVCSASGARGSAAASAARLLGELRLERFQQREEPRLRRLEHRGGARHLALHQPAILDSITSRDSRSASDFASSAESTRAFHEPALEHERRELLRCGRHALRGRDGVVRARTPPRWDRRTRTRARLRRSARAARRIRVFLMTANLAPPSPQGLPRAR